MVHSPERAAALLRSAARIERTAQRQEQAAAILIRALEVYPDDAESARELYQALTELGHHDKLISVLTTAAGAAQDSAVRAGHWISTARLLANARGDLGAAIAALRRVAQAEPNHAPVWLELAELYIRSRQWEQAAQCLGQALQRHPVAASATAARLRLAELYHEHLKRTSDAAALLREVIREAPQETRAQRRLLAIEIEGGQRTAEATAEVWVQNTTGKEQAEALTTLGRLQRDAGKSAEAQQSFARAVALCGVTDGAHRDLVRIFQKEERAGKTPQWRMYADALLAFCRGEVSVDDKASALLEVSRVLIDRLHNPEQGQAALAAGLRLKPDDFVLQQELCARLTQAMTKAVNPCFMLLKDSGKADLPRA